MKLHLKVAGLTFSFLVVASVFGGVQQSPDYPESLKQLHKNVLINILEGAEDDGEVSAWSGKLNKEGFWPDIDYDSKQRGAWEPANHLTRLVVLAKAYQTQQSTYYQDADLSKKIHKALNYWLDNDLICPNWWYPEIGVPMRLAPTLFLMEEELAARQKEKAIKILDRAELGMTGQNKVWLAGNVLMKSLLLRDEAMIHKAAVSIKEELRTGSGEGIQADWSFHQHGSQLQFGNYGLSYATSLIQWISLLRKTPFRFNEDKMSILRNYLLAGQQWVVWKQRMDISSCGRQLFIDSPQQKASSIAGAFKKMEALDPDFSDKYVAANQYTSLTGHKHFWKSDYQVQRTSDYYFSVKMCSERVIGAESCNSENMQGYYMGDGAAFLYQSGLEFENIFPFWDWKKIPGTTTHQDKEPLPVLTCRGYRIDSDFVGGVTDREFGIAALDYKRDGLSAKKSWFLFEDIILCLGAGITSAEEHPVTTSVNQIFLNGKTLVKERSARKLKEEKIGLQNPKWVWHNNTGYYFPKGGNLQLETATVSGSWSKVAIRYPEEKIQAKLFKLWFEHGVRPADQSYAYYMLPNAKKKDLRRMERKPSYKILKNDKTMQAVVAADGSMAGVVFYDAGQADVFGGIKVDQACIVLLKIEGDGMRFSIADPTQKLEELSCSFEGPYVLKDPTRSAAFDTESATLTLKLGSNEDAGRTLSVLLSKK